MVGADGAHSTVRRLVFGPQERFLTHPGLYVATTMLGRADADPGTVLIHNEPGRAVVIHPTTGVQGVAFLFRYPQLPVDRVRDVAEQKLLIAARFAGMGWRVPELLRAVGETSDLYFDSVSRIRVGRWSRGRTVLVGDAADCVSLFGEGLSMAIAGAATLARSLAACPDDPVDALRRYERVHRRRLWAHHLGARWPGMFWCRRPAPASAPGTRCSASGRVSPRWDGDHAAGRQPTGREGVRNRDVPSAHRGHGRHRRPVR